MASKKISISIDDNLLEMIDEFAEDNYMTRSGFLTLVSKNYLQQQEVVKTLGSLRATLDTIKGSGELDPKSEADLQAFMHFAETIGQ